jgi:hypothetical protein
MAGADWVAVGDLYLRAPASQLLFVSAGLGPTEVVFGLEKIRPKGRLDPAKLSAT